MGIGSFLGVKRSGRGVDHPPPHLSPKVKERFDLYLHPLLVWPLSLPVKYIPHRYGRVRRQALHRGLKILATPLGGTQINRVVSTHCITTNATNSEHEACRIELSTQFVVTCGSSDVTPLTTARSASACGGWAVTAPWQQMAFCLRTSLVAP